MTFNELKNNYYYNPNTGMLYRLLKNKSRLITARDKFGHVVVTYKRKGYKAHRLIWFYMTGEWPDIIDHINRIPYDNKWCNLRNGNYKLNSINRKLASNSLSNIKGVTYIKKENMWRSRIGVNGKQIYLGYFKTKEEAANAYKIAVNKYYGEI